MPYTDAFKGQMVKRMVGPGAVSAAALARQVGVSQPTLSQWLREANRVAAMTPPPEEKKPAGPKKWTPEEKLRVLAEAHGLEGEALGALLRREGLHEEQLAGWRAAAAGALSQGAQAAAPGALTASQRRRLASSEKRVKELERELRRKEKALAETAALLVLEKKLQALGWDERPLEDEDDAADEKSEK
ncbi:helix-turn-helix domain-containing protein [Myxococcus stipitatus]|uniref:transposase n=1 Tax=Myxococcus stipitatus TaxID=83455 RepID=UPI001F47F203|nr:transposase [Myxococcus stipitatus]MCE9674132.1 helix-turn-helix domain-containing protein [Myxococcus stipitatus]